MMGAGRCWPLQSLNSLNSGHAGNAAPEIIQL